MVEAPEKIWVHPKERTHWTTLPPETNTLVQFVRSDIAERQNAELRAAVDVQRQSKEYAQRCCEKAEAENARLRALPLKDEVERVLEEGRKNTVAVMKALMATGSRDNLLLADAVHRADDAARALLSRLRAQL